MAVKQRLDHIQMSLFFVNALGDPARLFLLTNCSSNMPFEQIVSIMKRHYSSEARKLQIQSEMHSLDLVFFMNNNQITDNSLGLSKLVDHINSLVPRLLAGFAGDPHKTRYLRRAVMSLDWAAHPISQIATSKYSFTQFITALQESLQLQNERLRVQALSVGYGQYLNNPRDVAFPHNRRSERRRLSHRERTRSRSPYYRGQRSQ